MFAAHIESLSKNCERDSCANKRIYARSLNSINFDDTTGGPPVRPVHGMRVHHVALLVVVLDGWYRVDWHEYLEPSVFDRSFGVREKKRSVLSRTLIK